MHVWFLQKEVITFKSLLVKQHFADGMQGFLKEASCFFVAAGWVSRLFHLFWQWNEPPWSCRYRSPGVEPWLIVTFWPFLDCLAKVFLTFPIPLAESGMFGGRDAWDPYTSPLLSPFPPASNLTYLTSKNNVAQVVYAPIQTVCLSWT